MQRGNSSPQYDFQIAFLHMATINSFDYQNKETNIEYTCSGFEYFLRIDTKTGRHKAAAFFFQSVEVVWGFNEGFFVLCTPCNIILCVMDYLDDVAAICVGGKYTNLSYTYGVDFLDNLMN